MLSRLPNHHSDPFDRMLVCQAMVGKMAIMTPDKSILRYKVKAAW
jgi:PIN domain nuclease of toxin-antitoxin system